MPWKDCLSVGLAVLTCPCHLPLLLGALAGTALGGWLGQHTLAVTLGMAGIFLCALVYIFRSLTHHKARSGAGHEQATDPVGNESWSHR